MPACQTNERVVPSALDLMIEQVQSRKLEPRFQPASATYNPVRHTVLKGNMPMGSRHLYVLTHKITQDTKKTLKRVNRAKRGTSNFTSTLRLLAIHRDMLEHVLQATDQAIRTEFKLNPEDEFVILSGWRVASVKPPLLPRLNDEKDDVSEAERPTLFLVANNG